MNIAVVCGYLQSLEPLAKRTVEVNKREYCDRHGYTLFVPRNIEGPYFDPKSHASGFTWSRLLTVKHYLSAGKWDWVWVVGADTLVTNMTIRLEDIIATAAPHKHLLISGERVAPLQADSFLIRGTPEGIAYVRDILSTHDQYKHHPWVENQAMIDRRELHAGITHIVPQWMLNSYTYDRFYHCGDQYRDGTDCYGNRGQWIKGDFLIHWPAASLKERLEFLRIYEPKIVR